MYSTGAQGKTMLEADSIDENLTVPLVLLIVDQDEAVKVSMIFIVNAMSVGGGFTQVHLCRGRPRSNRPAYLLTPQNRRPGPL